MSTKVPIEFRWAPGVQGAMESTHGVPNAFKKTVVTPLQPESRQAEIRNIIKPFTQDAKTLAGACPERVTRLKPAAAFIGEEPVVQHIGNGDTIIANHRNLPERKALPHREPHLDRQMSALHHQVDRRIERHARRNFYRYSCHGDGLLDSSGDGDNLLQWMTGLFEQNISRSAKPPVTELPCRNLAQWHVAQTTYEICPTDLPLPNNLAQTAERGMKYEVLIDPKRNSVAARFRVEYFALATTDRQRFLQKNRNTCPQEWQCGLNMRIRRREHVNAVHLTRRNCFGS